MIALLVDNHGFEVISPVDYPMAYMYDLFSLDTHRFLKMVEKMSKGRSVVSDFLNRGLLHLRGVDLRGRELRGGRGEIE